MATPVFTNRAIHYRPDIDGLRALAVLSVFLFHINSKWLPGGYLGVDLFFVISGYLITSIIRRQLVEDRFLFREFYARRIRRILPLFFTVIFVVSIVSFLLLLPDDYKKYWRTVRYAIQFVANQAFTNQDYFDVASEEKPLLHLWSLAIEEQFYFFWPLILFLSFKLLKKLKLSLNLLFWLAISGIVISTLIANHSIQNNPDASYFLLRNRAAELLVGCALALNPYSIPRSFRGYLGGVGLLIILACFIFYSRETPYPGTYALIPTIAGLLFILDTEVDRPYKKVFTNRWVRQIGLWSFSIYLWHWPILALMRYILQSNELPTSWIVVAVFLTFILSIASYYLVENPVRRLKFSFKKSLFLIFIIPAFLVVIGYYSTRDYQAEIYPTNKEQLRWFDDGESCYDIISDNCSVGSQNEGAFRYLLVGDSHAVHLAGMLDVIGQEENITFDIYSASACPVYFGYSKSKNINTLCLSVNNYLTDHWQDYDAVMFSQFYYAHIYDFSDRETHIDYLGKLENTIDEISKEVPVVMISDIPDIGIHPPRVKRMQLLGFDISPFSREESMKKHQIANHMIEKLTNNYINVFYLDLTPYIMRLLNQASLIYRDKDHLNPLGSRSLGEEIMKNGGFINSSD